MDSVRLWMVGFGFVEDNPDPDKELVVGEFGVMLW